MLSKHGKGFLFNNKMGVYRYHGGGITKVESRKDMVSRSVDNYQNLYETLLPLVNNDDAKFIRLAKVLKADYPWARMKCKEKKCLQCITTLFKASLSAPLWCFALIKKKLNKGLL